MEIITKIEKLEAELKLEKLEQKFVQAKADGKVTPKMKAQVRAARQDYRDNFRNAPVVTVSPGTIGTSTGIGVTKAVSS